MRLLDVGCGWGGHGAARGASTTASTPSASRCRAARPSSPRSASPRPGSPTGSRSALPGLPRRRRRPVRRDQLDRHVRARRLDAARRVLRPAATRCSRPGGRLLNHGISAARGGATVGRTGRARFARRGFIDRYVFPDGELHEVGSVVTAIQRTGFEVRHVESLREHYALTLRAWVREPRSATGTTRSPRPARRGPASGGSTWPRPRSASRTATPRSTRCSAVKPDGGRSGMPLRPRFDAAV